MSVGAGDFPSAKRYRTHWRARVLIYRPSAVVVHRDDSGPNASAATTTLRAAARVARVELAAAGNSQVGLPSPEWAPAIF